MTNIKQGDILKRKDGTGEHKVLGVCGEVYFMSFKEDHKAYFNTISLDVVEDVFIIPEEEWVPKDDEEFWFLTATGADCGEYEDFTILFDQAKKGLGVYKSQSEALTAFNKCKKALGRK